MNSQDYIRKAVEEKLHNAQDNLHRARAVAGRCNAAAPYGESGQTLHQIIAGYEKEITEAQTALDSL